MKRYLLERGLLLSIEFIKNTDIESAQSFDALLEKAWAYMDYKENEAANRARDSRNRRQANASRQQDEQEEKG